MKKDQHKPTVHIGVIGRNHEGKTLLDAINMVLELQAKKEQSKPGENDAKEGGTNARHTGSDEC